MIFTVAIDGPAAAGKGTLARAVAPLRAADDAVVLDTSDMTIDQAVAQAIATINARLDAA